LSSPTSVLEAAKVAYASNDFKAAARFCREHLETVPDEVAAFVLLAAIYLRSGKATLAAGYLDAALRLDPKCFEAYAAYSSVYALLGNSDGSIQCAITCTELAPQDPDAFNHLGLTYIRFGRLNEAIEAFRRATCLSPDASEGYRNLAMALREAHLDSEAIEVWGRVAMLEEQGASALIAIAQLHIMYGRHEDAISTLSAALEKEPHSSPANVLMALALAETKQSADAVRFLERAIELDPSNGLAYAGLGYWLQERGDFESAQEKLLKAIDLNPSHGFAYYNLFRGKKVTAADQEILDQMAGIRHSAETPLQDRAYIEYALGKAEEDLGNYSDSFQHYQLANQLSYRIWLANSPWDRQKYHDGFMRIKQYFDRERFHTLSGGSQDCETPIFVVGMIRSGTSLIEQIISSHPEVEGAGELSFWHRNEFAVNFNAEVGQTNIDSTRLMDVAREYLAELRTYSETAKHIVDKMPHNYALIGHIHAAFPKAKIIHLKRHPIDNCVSVYTTAFQRPPSFAHLPENIVFAYKEYQSIMAHWRTVLPEDSMIEVDYENLVADREAVVRRVIDFCGLEWNNACLNHETNRRSVKTPSLWQVRQPIYKTSVERWKRFEPWIPEFLALG